jgi:hypothetical protein
MTDIHFPRRPSRLRQFVIEPCGDFTCLLSALTDIESSARTEFTNSGGRMLPLNKDIPLKKNGGMQSILHMKCRAVLGPVPPLPFSHYI